MPLVAFDDSIDAVAWACVVMPANAVDLRLTCPQLFSSIDEFDEERTVVFFFHGYCSF